MRLEVHLDGVKKVDLPRITECNDPLKTKANINLMVM
jgi:hypothetical protein